MGLIDSIARVCVISIPMRMVQGACARVDHDRRPTHSQDRARDRAWRDDHQVHLQAAQALATATRGLSSVGVTRCSVWHSLTHYLRMRIRSDIRSDIRNGVHLCTYAQLVTRLLDENLMGRQVLGAIGISLVSERHCLLAQEGPVCLNQLGSNRLGSSRRM